jgi:asparagine synthase (glutamine-hydrolysing)
MCGIAGFIDRAEQNALPLLRQMLGTIVHRGPDGEGCHIDQSLGFAMGMRRLSIIDLEGGTQPIWNEDETIAVVFNGEIYNYIELRRELESKGHHFRTQSDTEVLIHLYEERRTAMFDRLRGMFAFCILDRKRQTVLLARDHFGQKPLYFTSARDRFAFASELKALLTLQWVERNLDPDAFLDYAAWLSLPAPRTHLRNVQKLSAGTYLELSLDVPNEISPVRYWQYHLTERPDLETPDTAIAALDAALSESSRLHLRADVPVGVLLSSGLDSRTVAAYAQDHTSGTVQTFTVGFGDEDSELTGAAQVAQEIQSQHHSLELGPRDLGDAIERIALLLDEPVGDPACFAVLKVCELARGYVKVLLSGEGSDELFGGYETRYAGMLATMERTDWIRKVGNFFPSGNPYSSSRWDRLFARGHTSPACEIARLRIEGFPGDVRAPRGLTVEQMRTLQERETRVSADVVRPQRDRLSELLAFDLDWQLTESLLQKADKMSMGASIELRTPILDREVASVAARIPSSLKLPAGGPGKLILRQTLAQKLKQPAESAKKGFPVPLGAWFRGHLREQVESTLFASDSIACTQLDRGLLRAAWDDLQASRWDGARAFYSLWLYETWYRVVMK